MNANEKQEIIFNLNRQFKIELNNFYLLNDIEYNFYFDCKNELILSVYFKNSQELSENFVLNSFSNINKNNIKEIQKMFFSFSSIIEIFFKRQSKNQIMLYSRQENSYLDSIIKLRFLNEEQNQNFRNNIKKMYSLLNRIDKNFQEKRFVLDLEDSTGIQYNSEINIFKDEIVNEFFCNVNYIFEIVDELHQPQKMMFKEEDNIFIKQVYFISRIKNIDEYLEQSELFNLV